MSDDEARLSRVDPAAAPEEVRPTSVIALFNFFNRFAHALAIPVTK